MSWQAQEREWVSVDSNSNSDLTPSDLSRSLQLDRDMNTHGLPDDIVCLIATMVSLDDAASASRTCKSWRRCILKECVWRSFAAQLGVPLVDRSIASIRLQVIRFHGEFCAPDFVFPKHVAELNAGSNVSKAFDSNLTTLDIAVMSPFSSNGCGKTALIHRGFNGVFLKEYDPTIEDSYRFKLFERFAPLGMLFFFDH